LSSGKQSRESTPRPRKNSPVKSVHDLGLPLFSHFSIWQGCQSQKALVGSKGEDTRQEKLVASQGKSREKGIQQREKEGFQLAKSDTVLQGQKDQLKAAKNEVILENCHSDH